MKNPNIFYRCLTDIRCWLLIFLLVRMIGIHHPPVEGIHNWRQSTVCMVARNFQETEANILYPRVDMAGEKTGITGMEFPLLNFAMFLADEAFGFAHWYGRLINLIISTLGVWFFYLIVKRFFNRNTALYAGLILSCSLWFLFSRKSMPDTFAVSLLMAGLWVAIKFLTDQGNTHFKNVILLFVFIVLTTAGLLSKIPAGVVISPLALLFFKKSISMPRKIFLALSFILCLVPVVWWYFIWSPHLTETFGFSHFFMGLDIRSGWSELLQHPFALARQFFDLAIRYSGFAAFLLGIFFMIKTKSVKLTAIFVLSFASLFIVMLMGGYTFIRHSYYMIPFIPCMALLAACGLEQLPWKRIAIVLLLLVCIENVTSNLNDLRLKPEESAVIKLELSMDKYTSRDALIIINSDQNPTPMYLAHRKGWVTSNLDLQDAVYLADKKAKGATIVLTLKRVFGKELILPLEVLEDTPDWTIYRL